MTMRMKLSLSCLMAFCMAFCLALGVARAQPQPQQPSQPNALQGFSQNRNQPVQINAQTLEVRDKSKVATYTGNVRLVQGDTTLRCKTLIVYYDGDQAGGPSVKASTPGPAGSQQIRHIEAIGSVIVTQKDQTATGEKAIYDIKDDTVTLSPVPGGYVVVTQGQDVVRGRHLTVHLASGVSQFDGGDVMSVIVPKNQNQNQGAAPAHPPSHVAPKSRSTSPSDLY
jgi:lipopolysaccharide export system protein LptA